MSYRLFRWYVFQVLLKVSLSSLILLGLFVFLVSMPLADFLSSLGVEPGPWYYGALLAFESSLIAIFCLNGFLLKRTVIHGEGGNPNRRSFFIFFDQKEKDAYSLEERDFSTFFGPRPDFMAFSVTHLPGHAWSVSPLVESRVGVVAASVPELGGNVNFEIAASLSGPYSEKEVADFLVKERLKRGADFVSYENYLLGTFLDYLPQGLTKAFDNARDIFNDEDPSMADLADKFIEASSTDFRPVLLSNVVGIKVSIPSGPCDEVIDAGEVEFCNESENEW